MKKELKEIFKSKNGLLILLTIVMALVIAYLNIITIKSLVIGGKFEISYGTLLVSFVPMLIGDLLAECYGWKKSFIISSISYFVSFIFVLVLWGTTKLPGVVFGGFGTDSYNLIFNSQPILLFASAFAYYVGIFFNCFIMGKMKEKSVNDNGWKLFARCILSTLVGQFLDNALFFLIGYMPDMINVETRSWAVTYVWQQISAALVIETVYEIILFPITKLLTKKVNMLED